VSQPYTPGQTLAWLDLDPDGIRVHRATVSHIEASAEHDRWRISTDRGDAIVDHTGNSGHVIPIDTDIATQLYVRGDGYLVRPTLMDHPHVLERDINDLALDHDTGLGDDLELD